MAIPREYKGEGNWALPSIHVGKNIFIRSSGAHYGLGDKVEHFLKLGVERAKYYNNGFKFELVKRGSFVVCIPLEFFKPSRNKFRKELEAWPFYGVVFPIDANHRAILEKANEKAALSIPSSRPNPRAIGTFILERQRLTKEVIFATQTHGIAKRTLKKAKSNLNRQVPGGIIGNYTQSNDWRNEALREVIRRTNRPIKVQGIPTLGNKTGDTKVRPAQFNCARKVAQELDIKTTPNLKQTEVVIPKRKAGQRLKLGI